MGEILQGWYGVRVLEDTRQGVGNHIRSTWHVAPLNVELRKPHRPTNLARVGVILLLEKLEGFVVCDDTDLDPNELVLPFFTCFNNT